MSLCAFDDPSGLLLTTPVENLFIEEYMPHARPEYVKVYIYGLKLCYQPQPSVTLERFARDVHLDERVVREAFAYWERQGIVRRVSERPLAFHYYSIQKVMISERPAESELDGLYQYRNFNGELQDIFENKLLGPKDYALAIDWIETLGFDETTVLMVLRHFYRVKNGKLSMEYVDTVLRDLRAAQIVTYAQVEAHLKLKQPTDVVRYLGGGGRNASMPEADLYMKWTENWGFTHEAILAACDQTKTAQTPSFAYVDKVLERCREAGAVTLRDVRKYLGQGQKDRDTVREVLQRLGVRRAATEGMVRIYDGWIEAGFSHPAILSAAEQAQRRGSSTLEGVDAVLRELRAQGVTDAGAIDQYLAGQSAMDEEVQEFLEHAGEFRRTTARDREMFRKWTEEDGWQVELVFLAAEQAKTARDKLSYIGAVLKGWNAQGIRTFSAAKAFVAAKESGAQDLAAQTGGPAGAPLEKKLSKNVSAQNFTQREAAQGDYEHLITRFDPADEEEGT